MKADQEGRGAVKALPFTDSYETCPLRVCPVSDVYRSSPRSTPVDTPRSPGCYGSWHRSPTTSAMGNSPDRRPRTAAEGDREERQPRRHGAVRGGDPPNHPRPRRARRLWPHRAGQTRRTLFTSWFRRPRHPQRRWRVSHRPPNRTRQPRVRWRTTVANMHPSSGTPSTKSVCRSAVGSKTSTSSCSPATCEAVPSFFEPAKWFGARRMASACVSTAFA